MKRNTLLILMAFTLPFISFLSACRKENLSETDKELSQRQVAIATISKSKLPITKISGVVNPLDIQFDYDGNLYILTSKSIMMMTGGQLKTLSLPDTVFTDFSTYDGWVLGPIKHITAGRDGTIFLAGDQGIRMVYNNNKWVRTYVSGDIGWGISSLQDLSVTQNNELYYAGGYDGLVRAVPEFPQTYSQGLYPFGDSNTGFVSAVDCANDNIAWLGTDKGIGSVLLPPRPDYYEGYEFKLNYLGDPNGKKTEGPVKNVKFGSVKQLEATNDGSIICFIEDGKLKEIKNDKVRMISPLANDTHIALSNDGQKLYYIENSELYVIDL